MGGSPGDMWKSCDVGEAKEGLENELWLRWSNGRVGEWALLILQAFRCFTHVTAHYPTLPSLYLHHSSFSNPSVASPTTQLILQPFPRFTYITTHSPTLLSLHYITAHSLTILLLLLHHSIFTYVTRGAAHALVRVYVRCRFLYPVLAEKAVRFLLPFTTRSLCESDFSSLMYYWRINEASICKGFLVHQHGKLMFWSQWLYTVPYISLSPAHPAGLIVLASPRQCTCGHC